VSRKERYLLSNGRSIRAERYEKAGPSSVRAPTEIEASKRFILVIMEVPTGLANGAHRQGGKRLRRKRLKGLSALFADFVDRTMDLADLLQVHRVVENATIFQEYQKPPNGFAVARTWIAARGFGGDLSALPNQPPIRLPCFVVALLDDRGWQQDRDRDEVLLTVLFSAKRPIFPDKLTTTTVTRQQDPCSPYSLGASLMRKLFALSLLGLALADAD
jgi:hypothetical protein